MARLKFVFVLCGLIFLSACQAGSGYSIGSWRYGGTNQQPAQDPPSTLASTYEPTQETEQGIAQGTTIQETIQNEPIEAIPANQALTSVKVALLLPLTGEHSSLGQAMLKAAQIALFDVGHESLELLPRDTQGTPSGAQQAAQEALHDGAQLILGPVFSSSVRAAKSVARRSNVNVIAFSTDWGQAGSNTFIMGFLPFDQIQRITAYAAKQNLLNIAVIAPNTDYGRSVMSAYNSVARPLGIFTTEMATFPPDSPNLAPDLREFTQYDERILQTRLRLEMEGVEPEELEDIDLLQEPPPYDAVLMPVGGDLALSIANLLSHYELPPGTVKRLGTGLLDDLGLASEDSLNGAWFAAPSPRLRENFENRFLQIYGYRAPRLATLAYDASALAAVLARRGLQNDGRPSFDRNSIMNPNGFAGIDGIFRFRSDGTAERGLAILEFRNGQIRIIDEAPRTFQRSFGY